MRTIADFQGRSNNLGLARWIAAVLVVFSHAYGVLGLGPDPLEQLSGGQVSFGGLAVALFLFASGFFVSRSLRQKSGRQFFRSRMVRLYPAFAVVILLSVFVLGPLATTLSAGAYFSSPGTWSYLLYLVMVPRYFLPGVFEANPVSHVNASLWTMILEALCYLALFIAGTAWSIQTGANSVSMGNEFFANIVLPTQIVTQENVLDVIKGTHWDMSAYNY